MAGAAASRRDGRRGAQTCLAYRAHRYQSGLPMEYRPASTGLPAKRDLVGSLSVSFLDSIGGADIYQASR